MNKMSPSEVLARQTAFFLAAAGIEPDRKADHDSREWKLFMAGLKCAELAAGTVRIPLIREGECLAASPAAPAAELPSASKTFEQRLDQLIHEVSSANFWCGEHDIDADEAGYAPILARADRAGDKLRAFVIAALAGAPVVEAAPTWISVDERRPDDRQAVAFIADTKDWETFAYLHGRPLGGTYDAKNNWFSVPGLSVAASHWMPLPAAPAPTEAQ